VRIEVKPVAVRVKSAGMNVMSVVSVPYRSLLLYACDAACHCFGHADSCFYDAAVASYLPTLNAAGVRSGGGVCVDCRHNTTGNSDVSRVTVFSPT